MRLTSVSVVETSRLRAYSGVQSLAVVGDLMNMDDCKRAVEETVAAFGGLDVLVNSGGWDPASCLSLPVPWCNLGVTGGRRAGRSALRSQRRQWPQHTAVSCQACNAASSDARTSLGRKYVADLPLHIRLHAEMYVV